MYIASPEPDGDGRERARRAQHPARVAGAPQADFEAEDLRDRMRTQRGRWSGQARERDPDLLSSEQTRQLAGQIAGLERQLASLQVNDTGQENLGSLRHGIVRKRNELESELSANAARALPDLPDDVRQALVAYRLTQADLAGVEARRQWLAGQVASYQSSVLSGPGTQIEEQRLIQDTDEEIETGRVMALVSAPYEAQTVNNVAQEVALSELYGAGHDLPERFEEALKKVTREDLMRVIDRYMKHMLVVVTGHEEDRRVFDEIAAGG